MLKQVAYLWLLVGIFLLAGLFYLYNLNQISFWEDESWLAIAIGDGIADVWTFATNRGVHPPFYFYLAFFLKPFIGDTEYALRWIGGMVSLIGVAFSFQLGQAMKDKRTGLFLALLVAGSFFLIYYSRLARQYSVFYTLSVMTLWAYWRWQALPKNNWLWIIFLAQAGNLYTHYFSVFLAAGIALHALFTVPLRQTLRLWGTFIASGIAFLPWLPSILVQMQSDLGDGVYYAVNKVQDIAPNYISRVTNDNYWLGGAFGLVGMLALMREKAWRLLGLILTVVILPFIPIVIVNQTVFQWYIGRNMMYSLPLVLLLYAFGLASLSKWRLGRIVAITVACVFVAWGVYVFPAFWTGTADWRGAMQAVSVFARPTDLYVIDGERYSTDYYMRRFLDTRLSFLPMLTWTSEPVWADRIWLIDSGQAVNIEAEALAEANGMAQTRRIVRLPVVAELYQRLPTESEAIFGEQLALGYTGEETLTVQRGDTLLVDVWWQALRNPDFNYSASFQIWGDGWLLTQTDGNFDEGRLDAQVLPVGVWMPDTRYLTIAPDAPVGDYTLRVTVYDWRDNSRLPVDSESEDDLFVLLRIVVE